MDIIEAVRSRKSIRGYKPDPIPDEILREIIEIAGRSPSATNSQPWEITVIKGKVLENIIQGNIEMSDSGVEPHPDIQRHNLEGKYRQRQATVAIELFRLMGIAREDRERRKEWNQLGLRFFNAPVALILCLDKSAGHPQPIFEIGTISQTICLVALNYGLGTCIENQGIVYPEVIRKFAGISESKRIITSIAIGYPDWDYPANAIESTRESIDNFVTWLD
ncbi:nitroreductase [Chloroflexota bacterium]